MIARLTAYEHVDLTLVDQLRDFLASQDRDPFAELPGYRGQMTLLDRDNARLVGIGFYETADHAREAEALLAAPPAEWVDALPEHLRPALAMTPDSAGLYEVVDRP
jgi:hypothetical protein